MAHVFVLTRPDWYIQGEIQHTLPPWFDKKASRIDQVSRLLTVKVTVAVFKSINFPVWCYVSLSTLKWQCRLCLTPSWQPPAEAKCSTQVLVDSQLVLGHLDRFGRLGQLVMSTIWKLTFWRSAILLNKYCP
jgi:hypothetical protein